MSSVLSLAVGLLIGQWVALGALASPADFHGLGVAAWQQRDYAGALRHWSEGVTARPDDPLLHYRRATALAHLGQWHAATDAYRLALLLDPPPTLARLARHGLAQLHAARDGGVDTVVPLEPLRGVWLARVRLNGSREARFLVDTGSSVTIVAPALAVVLGLSLSRASVIALQTVGGPAAGPAGTLPVVRVGDAEARNLPVVVHDPGPGIEGILGNSFLGRYRVTLDAHRRLLHLTSTASD